MNGTPSGGSVQCIGKKVGQNLPEFSRRPEDFYVTPQGCLERYSLHSGSGGVESDRLVKLIGGTEELQRSPIPEESQRLAGDVRNPVYFNFSLLNQGPCCRAVKLCLSQK